VTQVTHLIEGLALSSDKSVYYGEAESGIEQQLGHDLSTYLSLSRAIVPGDTS
jgi:hypothetical protein